MGECQLPPQRFFFYFAVKALTGDCRYALMRFVGNATHTPRQAGDHHTPRKGGGVPYPPISTRVGQKDSVGIIYPKRGSMGKNAKKKLIRQFGGDASQVAQTIQTRQVKLTEKIEKMGGAEKVHKMHSSAIVGAKPKRRGRITSPDNPFVGYYITEFQKGGYFLYVPRKRGDEHKFQREISRLTAPAIGGVVCPHVGRLGVALPPSAKHFVRSLQVLWGA